MTGALANGRAQRVVQYLSANPNGATARQLVIAVEPGCNPANMSATLGCLVKLGKVTRSGEVGHLIYKATTTALVDRRRVANAAKKGKPRPRRKPARAPEARRQTQRPTPAKTRGATTQRPPRRTGEFRITPAPIKRAANAGAAPETVEQYLARGGRIQRLAHGAVSQPLKFAGHRAVNEATWRDRADTV